MTVEDVYQNRTTGSLILYYKAAFAAAFAPGALPGPLPFFLLLFIGR